MSLSVPARYVWLDLVRGACALAVCAGHLRLVMMPAFSEIANRGIGHVLFYLATGLASQAVMVFFVLSGLLVGGSVLKAGENFRLLPYLVSRITRLWVVLLPALVLTLVVDTFTLQHAPGMANGDFAERWTSGPTYGTYTTSLVAFIGNALFLNKIFLAEYGSNLALWSLACEFWYYVTFPLLARAVGLIGRQRDYLWRVVALAVAVGIIACMPRIMATGFIVWLMGVGAAVIADRAKSPVSRRTVLATVAGFALALFFSKIDYLGIVTPIPSMYVVGLGFAMMAAVLVRRPPPPNPVRCVASFSSDISYSLYLVHFPLTIYLATRWYADGPLTPTPFNIAIFLAWMVGLVVAGWVFWLAFERHTARIRIWVGRWIGVAPRPTPVEQPPEVLVGTAHLGQQVIGSR